MPRSPIQMRDQFRGISSPISRVRKQTSSARLVRGLDVKANLTLACLTSVRAKLSKGSAFPSGAFRPAKAAAATASALAAAAAPGVVLPDRPF